MLIREMEGADAAALAELYLVSRQHAFPWLNSSQLSLEDFARDTAGEKIWVAEEGGAILGFVSVWESENYIHNLFVRSSHYRRGIGTALMDRCLQAMGRPARLKCLTENLMALDFYRSRGWSVIAEGTGSDGEYLLLQYSKN